MMHRCVAVGLLATFAAGARAQPTFKVSFDKSVRAEAATGRLIVYLVRDGSSIGASEPPSSGPFWDDPQPMFGTDVKDLAPGQSATVDDSATSLQGPLSKLAPGSYRVQAVLDLHQDNSDWKREPGNLYSDTTTIKIGAADGPTAFPITLARAVGPRTLPTPKGVEWFEVKSRLLSEFHHRDIALKAGVVLPIGYDAAATRLYSAVYEVPGFGSERTDAAPIASARARLSGDGAEARLARSCFWIVLDPESGNGHTLFADSANNGPWGKALTTELIPALEARYHLKPDPFARLLRGHSSGGWSTLWLALTYPETFGATWSTSPDPVDFRRFQLPDIYGQKSLFTDGAGAELPSERTRGRVKMTIRQENAVEEVLGPDNTSGQQWDSWFAVFGPRNAAGHPTALFDPKTGQIDHAVAEQYKKYDIGELLRAEPGKYGLTLLQRCRIVVGDQDSYYLNEAVALLKSDVEKLSFLQFPEGQHGYIKILPGLDHGSVFMSPELRGISQEMLDHLALHKLIDAAK